MAATGEVTAEDLIDRFASPGSVVFADDRLVAAIAWGLALISEDWLVSGVWLQA